MKEDILFLYKLQKNKNIYDRNIYIQNEVVDNTIFYELIK